ncbi:hexose carrier protein HEX6-like [Gossypium australe]|uniref:Hexose carrier protein HEX6-like n=1 Tax=Gossypium australe TaxID=47621 RepID=A0A5B6UJK0_9ROSI|nr:hexose carrier protein HEX6-like [Gossypium australe]
MFATQITIGESWRIKQRVCLFSIRFNLYICSWFCMVMGTIRMLCFAVSSPRFFFFGGWVVGMAMTAFVYFLLPETTNVLIEQMEKVRRDHWFWETIVGEKIKKSKKTVQSGLNY